MPTEPNAVMSGHGEHPRQAFTASAESSAETRWDLLVLISACFFAPLIVWVNSSERAGPFGFVLLGLLLLGLALVARWLMIRVGLDPRGSTYAVIVLVFGFTNAGLLLDRGLPRSTLLGGLVAVGAIAYVVRSSGVFRAAILWGGLFIFAYPWLILMTTNTDPGTRKFADPQPLGADFLAEKRDIVFIVLDGYANSHVLSELYGFDTADFDAALTARGFDVSSQTTANYGRTRLSVSSVMQLGHPVSPGRFGSADFEHLLEVIGGENALTQWLQDNGYTHTYVESGWFGTRCASSVDTCVQGPWPNESLYDVTNRSLLKDLPGFETGRSFSRGAQKVLDWLTHDLEILLQNGAPDLVYAHVLSPHPPLFRDSNCVMRPQEGFKGFTIAQPGMTEADLEEAREWYAMQVECVNSFLVEVADLADETDSTVIMFGDHGPDSLGQLFIAGSEWSPKQRWERMSAMLAARVPGCDMSEIESLVNLGRRMVTCISDIDLPDLSTQTFESESTPEGERIIEVPAPSYGSTS